MKHTCPVCETALQETSLDRTLPAHQCPTCQGIWLSADDYFAWNNQHVSAYDLDAEQPLNLPYPLLDNNKALICPECHRFLRRYQVWPTVEFHLDRCSHCYGIWFDANEWQTLQAQALHKKIHLFFSPTWQETLRGVEMKQRFEQMYLGRFGRPDYDKIKELRQWLHTHPNGAPLIAYLTDKDPYSS